MHTDLPDKIWLVIIMSIGDVTPETFPRTQYTKYIDQELPPRVSKLFPQMTAKYSTNLNSGYKTWKHVT